ncbi:MAG: ribonuclease P protein component [Bacteroidetes bacterium]|nr:ribonuclease P protein component [Bacteroidota bacterium]MCY4232828.1 ribonuclease P protein component [Bacteroidota bacterium]
MTKGADQRFTRSMRLKRRRLIAPLFDRTNNGIRSVASGSIRILFRFVPQNETGVVTPVQIGFAPGRCKNSVQRNRLRRQMREFWRINQHVVPTHQFPDDQTLTLMVLARGAHRTKDVTSDLLKAMYLLHQSIKKRD